MERDAASGDDRAAQAGSFGAAAAAYERGRPPYPPAAVGWLVPDGVRTVLDLGAGTGKLTRRPGRPRAATCWRSSRPPGCARELARALPAVRALSGSAEEIPLPDAGVDAVGGGAGVALGRHRAGRSRRRRGCSPPAACSRWSGTTRDEREGWGGRPGPRPAPGRAPPRRRASGWTADRRPVRRRSRSARSSGAPRSPGPGCSTWWRPAVTSSPCRRPARSALLDEVRRAVRRPSGAGRPGDLRDAVRDPLLPRPGALSRGAAGAERVRSVPAFGAQVGGDRGRARR